MSENFIEKCLKKCPVFVDHYRVLRSTYARSLGLVKFTTSCTIVCMNLVSGTNIFLAVALNEPEKGNIIRLTSNYDAIAPEILPYEIGNALTAMLKRKQITKEEAILTLKIATQIPVRLLTVDISMALKLALKFNIYAYDAYFLQCAKSLSCPLITLDKRMKQVASDLNIQVLE